MTARADQPLVDQLFAGWLPGAMYPSELLWLATLIRSSGARVVVECGRQDGVSTWALATLLADTDIHIQSIDFDEDPDRLDAVRARLADLPVTCVSGDIHIEVPRLLDRLDGTPSAVVQDGPKGWEGLATTLAAALDPSVVLVAQHNLHVGHVSRTAFQMLAVRPCFVETDQPVDEVVAGARRREIAELPGREPNRPVDQTSLGVLTLDSAQRQHLRDSLPLLGRRFSPWDPRRVVRHWENGDFGYCSRIRRRSRFTTARFARR